MTITVLKPPLDAAGGAARRAVLYLRISDDEAGERAGVERQRADCEALVAREGWELVAVYEDNDRSAFSGKPRPAFDRLLADAADGVFDVVVCWASDRLYRLVSDLTPITRDLAPYARIVTVMGGEVDLESAEGIMRAQIMGSVGEFESRRKGERVRARARQRAERDGVTASAARPLGWAWAEPCPGGQACEHTRARCAPGEGRRPRWGSRRGLVPHPVEAPLLVQAYERVAGGSTLLGVTRWLSEQGMTGSQGRALSPTSVRSALLMPRNAGMASYRGQVTGPAATPGFVDHDRWETVRAILTDPARRTSPGRPVMTPLGKLASCGRCGGSMAASRKAGHPVYVCSAHQHLTRRRDLLDGPILAMARRVLVGLADAGLLSMPDHDDPSTAAVRAELLDVESRLEALASMVADGSLDPADYALSARNLRARHAEVSQRAARRSDRLATTRLGAAGEVGAAFDALQGEDLRQVLRELISDVVVAPATVTGHPSPADVEVRWAAWVPGHPPTRPEAPPPPLAVAERRHKARELRERGWTINAIADHLGVYRATIRKDLRVAA